MRFIARSRHLVTTFALAREAVLRMVVRELGVPFCSRHMVLVDRAVLGVGCSIGVLLSLVFVQIDDRKVQQLIVSAEVEERRECGRGANDG